MIATHTYFVFLLVMAGVTYLLRAVPFILLKGNQEPLLALVPCIRALYGACRDDGAGHPLFDG